MKDCNCIFCKIANGEIPSYTVYEDDDFKVIFDISPASKGHALVIPKEHYKNLFELDESIASKALVIAKKVATELSTELDCDGFNLLQNNEEIAGQTVFHFHIHLIPRYKNDNVKFTTTPGEIDKEFAEKLAEKIKNKLA
ncbi:MAG: HIT family protein [Lachnospiraceae bacterium]|nr:HIT family protein [Lachnospiraceae bacterium]